MSVLISKKMTLFLGLSVSLMLLVAAAYFVASNNELSRTDITAHTLNPDAKPGDPLLEQGGSVAAQQLQNGSNERLSPTQMKLLTSQMDQVNNIRSIANNVKHIKANRSGTNGSVQTIQKHQLPEPDEKSLSESQQIGNNQRLETISGDGVDPEVMTHVEESTGIGSDEVKELMNR